MGILGKLKTLITLTSTTESESREPSTDPVKRQLSDEGRVLRLLVKNQGQVQKADLLEKLEWTDSKADEVLAEMESSDDIRLIRRRGSVLICRPGFEPIGHQKI